MGVVDNSFHHPLCGLHACNVVVSPYNENGECECLGCAGVRCQDCERYKDLLDEADKNNWLRLERCINCMKQK
jgi:hypothetical protein